jgi:hypothetical protein
MVTASATTQSGVCGDFPAAVEKPRIGGGCRPCCSLRGDQFRREGDFGLAVSGLEIPVPGSETVVAMEAKETSEYFLKVQAFAADATTRRADDAAASHPFHKAAVHRWQP